MRVNRGSSSGSTTQTSAQQKAQEEARRRMEEARRQAELARKRAEEAAKKAREAELAAQRSRELATKAKAAAEAAQRAKVPEAPQLRSAAGAKQELSNAATKRADAAKAESARLAQESRTAMTAANEAARTAGAPEPYKRTNELQSGFEAPRGRRRDDEAARLFGTDARASQSLEASAKVQADLSYARLASDANVAPTLQQLGINDGATLRAFGQRLSRESEGGSLRRGDVPLETVASDARPGALAAIIREAAATVDGPTAQRLQRPEFADVVAAGGTPLAAATGEVTVQDAEETQRGLELIGLSGGDLARAGQAARPHLEAAAKAALKGEWQQVVGSLLEVAKSPESRDLAEAAIVHAAGRLPASAGIAKDLLTDPAVVGQLVSNPELHQAVRQLFTDGERLQGVRALLGNDTVRDAVLVAAGKDAEVQAALERVNLTPEQLREFGAASPHLMDAVLAARDGQFDAALTSLQRAVEVAPALSARLGNAFVERMPEQLKAQFASLGLTEADLKQSAGALPHLYAAVQQASERDFSGALQSLRQASLAGAPAVERAIRSLAGRLPEGSAARAVLTDERLVHQLVTNTAAFGSLRKLLQDGTRAEGLRELLGNASMRDEVLRVAGTTEPLAATLGKAGLSARDLVAAGAAAPHLWDAAEALSSGRYAEGLTNLQRAVEAAPQLAGRLADRVLERLPAPLKERFAALGITEADLKASKAALPQLFNAVEHAANGRYPDALRALGDAALTGTAVTEKVLGKIAEQLPPGIARSVLTDASVLRELSSNRALYGSLGKLFEDGTRMTGVRELLGNDRARDAVLGALGNDPLVQGALERMGLSPQDLVQAGDASPHLFDAAKAIAGGDWQQGVAALQLAADAAPELLNKLGGRLYDALPQNLRAGIRNLGLTRDDLTQAGAAMPHLISAAQLLGARDPQAALRALGEAVQAAPDLVAKAITATASRLPDSPLRSILTDEVAVRRLLSDSTLHASVGQLLQGTAEGLREGLRGISANSGALAALSTALWSDDGLRDRLEKIGFSSVADLAEAGSVIDDVMRLGENFTAGRYGDAIRDLGAIFQDLPDGLSAKIGNSIAERLNLPPGLGDLLIQGGDALSDPAVRSNFAEALEAFGRQDAGAFISNMAEVGRELANRHPEAAVGFLNMMGRLPGSVGRFFSNPDLNDALVRSGTVGNVFEAVELVAQGDVPAAMRQLAEAAGALLTYGDDIGVDLPFGRRIDTPLGEEGVVAVTQLFGQFVEALPASVKQKITTKVAELLAKSGASIIPGGSLLGLISDVPDLVSSLREDPKDAIEILLDGGQVALDVAGVVPGVGAVTGQLKSALGVVEFLRDAHGLVENFEEFRSEFAFG